MDENERKRGEKNKQQQKENYWLIFLHVNDSAGGWRQQSALMFDNKQPRLWPGSHYFLIASSLYCPRHPFWSLAVDFELLKHLREKTRKSIRRISIMTVSVVVLGAVPGNSRFAEHFRRIFFISLCFNKDQCWFQININVHPAWERTPAVSSTQGDLTHGAMRDGPGEKER